LSNKNSSDPTVLHNLKILQNISNYPIGPKYDFVHFLYTTQNIFSKITNWTNLSRLKYFWLITI